MPVILQSPVLRSTLVAAAALVATSVGAQANSAVTVSRKVMADSLLPEVAKSLLVSKVAAKERVSFAIALQPRDLSGLQKVANAVSDPSSPLYRHYLNPEEIGLRFGATVGNRQAVVDYLASKGITVTLNAQNGMAIIAEGTAENVQNAFGTTLANYKGTDPEGKTITFRANATAMSVPTSIASVVTCISGIETYTRPKRRASTATLTPQLISSAYGLTNTKNAGYLGAGRHLAFSNFDGLKVSDAATYVQYYGLPYPAAGRTSNVTIVTIGTAAYSGTRGGEGDLDLQMEIGQAPLADLRIYDSTNLLSVLTQEANDNWADVISESYGWSAGGTTAQMTATWNSWHNQHLAMTAQGITYMAASGDSSTHLSPYAYPDFDPEVLMVGGSITTVDDTTGARVSESGWSYSGGGWYNNPASSITWNGLPSWQKGVGVPTNIQRRLVPDVSFQAAANNSSTYSPGGVYVVYTPSSGTYANQQGLYTFDGTSCASPILAGMLVTMQGRLSAYDTGATRFRMGRIQDLIYGQNALAMRTDVYHDITSGTGLYKLLGSSADGGSNSSYTGANQSTATGWDFLTGFGTMDMDGFYKSLLPTGTMALTLGNFTGTVSSVQVVVQFRAAGTTTVLSTQTVYPAADGTLTITAPSTGTFDVAIKAGHWLQRTLSSQTFAANAATALPATTLVNGDVNGDNVVSAADLAAIKVALGTQVGDAGYNASADLNGDGSVSAADLSIAIVRLGSAGDN